MQHHTKVDEESWQHQISVLIYHGNWYYLTMYLARITLMIMTSTDCSALEAASVRVQTSFYSSLTLFTEEITNWY